MKISRLFIYPIKSCAGTEVRELLFDANGPIGDRRFLIIDADGRFMTQREHKAMAHIRPEIGASCLDISAPGYDSIRISLPASGERRNVQVWGSTPQGVDCGDEVAQWLSAILGTPCRLVQLPEDNARIADRKYAPYDTGVGYADGFPLLVTSQQSLDAISQLSGVDADVRRFRPNIVVDGAAEPFAELSWRVLKTTGGHQIDLVKPCERCVIPTRDPDTLESTPALTRVMAAECRIDGKIIFGQNGVFDGPRLAVGDDLTSE